LTLLAGIFINTTVAVQDWPDPPFSTPSHQPPFIEILNLSENQIVNSNSLNLRFTVTKPSSWISGPTMTWITPGYICWGKITSISYVLDGFQSNKTSANDPVVLGLRVYDAPPSRTLDFSINLTGLSDGLHSLIVRAEGECLYSTGPGSWSSTIVVGNSSETIFIVDTIPPTVTLISPKINVYNTTEIPLNFIVSEPSQIKYSLNALNNVTTEGNSTLSGLSYGNHNITVYALDAAGRTGASETVSFTITKPEFFPIVPVAAVVVIVIALAMVISLLLFRRHRRTAMLSK